MSDGRLNKHVNDDGSRYVDHLNSSTYLSQDELQLIATEAVEIAGDLQPGDDLDWAKFER